MPERPIEISPEVQDALGENRPVIALESTLIAHGMPRPRNFEVARSLLATVREQGAIPAIIAIASGKIRIGLSDTLLEQIANDQSVAKVSRADLPACLISGGLGATTVASTMIGAHLAGIRVFATGGIGGVHRGAEGTFDISADLLELAQTPVAVVSAGAKAVLDLPKTLEVLETNGVPVIGYQTDMFPAFYARSSGLPVPIRVDDVDQLAQMLATQWSLGYRSGVLIANPIPENQALTERDISRTVETAVAEAHERGVKGKAVTPYLLARISALTEGSSLEANIALVHNNARLAARLARALTPIPTT